MTHTPGPWIISRDSTRGSPDFGENCREIWGGAESDVAVAIVLYGADKLGADYSQGDRDARLIAAAPDLLKALQLIANTESTSLALEYVQGIARAAIAKATQ